MTNPPLSFKAAFDRRTETEKKRICDYLITTIPPNQVEKSELVENLNAAVELGMHQEARTIRVGEGILTMNVPTYVTGLCEQNDIEMYVND